MGNFRRKYRVVNHALIIAGVLFILFIISPTVQGGSEIIITAIPIMAFIILFGYGGQLSFAFGSLFASGAYFTGILLTRFEVPVIIAMLLSVIATGIISAIIGLLCNKQKELLIFALLTLAFNQIIWFIIWNWRSLTGGADGISGIDSSCLDLLIFSIDLNSDSNFYIFCAIIFIILFVFSTKLIDSPYGRVLRGFRSSELRLTAIGYNSFLYRWIAFIFTGMMCSVGGSLFALHQQYVGEHLAFWTHSGEIVIMALFGGVFSLYGSIIGAGVYILLSDVFVKIPFLGSGGGGFVVLGFLFILVVLYLKGGIFQGFEKIYAAIKSKD